MFEELKYLYTITIFKGRIQTQFAKIVQTHFVPSPEIYYPHMSCIQRAQTPSYCPKVQNSEGVITVHNDPYELAK